VPLRAPAPPPAASTRPRLLLPGVIALTAVAAVAVRLLFVNEVNSDYRVFLSPWYDALANGGGFAAVGREIGNYNPPYLYLLAAATYLPLPKIVAIKLISVMFDLVLAGFAGLIVRRSFGSWTAVLAFAVVLFTPSVLINSGVWGQCDSIYAAFVLGSLYFLLRARPWWACLFFGLALSFKLQAVFFLPVLLIMMLVNRQRLVAVLAIPAAFAAMLVPAWLAGRSLSSLLMVYPNQISTGGTGGAAGRSGGGGLSTQSTGLGTWTKNAPTLYQWVNGSTGWVILGAACAAAILIGATWLAWRAGPLSTGQIVLLAAALVLAVPFFLPEMHERYFYLADVLTVLAAFHVRRFWPVALVVNLCSVLSYAPFLWNRTPVALPLVAFAEFLAVLVTLGVLVLGLVEPGWRGLRSTARARSTGSTQDLLDGPPSRTSSQPGMTGR
jgi:Gpi18-like mannosyltransferase